MKTDAMEIGSYFHAVGTDSPGFGTYSMVKKKRSPLVASLCSGKQGLATKSIRKKGQLEQQGSEAVQPFLKVQTFRGRKRIQPVALLFAAFPVSFDMLVIILIDPAVRSLASS